MSDLLASLGTSSWPVTSGRHEGFLAPVEPECRAAAIRMTNRSFAVGREPPKTPCYDARMRRPRRATGIVLTGPFLVHSSVARINRELAAALLSCRDVDVGLKPRGIATNPPQSFSHGKAIRAAFHRRPRHLDLTIRHYWLHNFSRPPAGKLAVIIPWECGCLPRRWIERIQQNVDELWVPSRFVRDIFRKCGVDGKRIAVIPNGVDTKVFRPEGESWRPAQVRGFVFLFVGGMIARKGADLVLEAYRWAFREREDVTLVFKDIGSNSYYRSVSLLPRVRQITQKKGARVVVLTEELEDRKLAALYRGCDVLVAPYRGEGFCFPLAEALACGKPVITTAEGPSQEFCTPGCAYLIPARTIRLPSVPTWFGELAGECTWFEPDLEELAHWMRHAYEHREEAALRGARGVDRIRPALDWTTVTAKYLERVAALTRAGRTSRSRQAGALS
jgi:glycosyltransferase involved in cell wall biosynthesis